MERLFIAALAMSAAAGVMAQQTSPVGLWKNIDDETDQCADTQANFLCLVYVPIRCKSMEMSFYFSINANQRERRPHSPE